MLGKAVCLAALVGAAAPAWAQDPLADLGAHDRLQAALSRVEPEMAAETLRARVLGQFRLLARLDGWPALTDADVELQAGMDRAKDVNRAIAQVLQYDLDGDLIVSVDELQVVARAEVFRRLALRGVVEVNEDTVTNQVYAFVADRLRRDRDGDGLITMGEMAVRNRSLAIEGFRERRLTEQLLYDADGDGVATEDEVNATVDIALGLLDRDGDGIVTREEIDGAVRWLHAELERLTPPPTAPGLLRQ